MDVLVKDDETKIPSAPLLRHHQREELKQEIEEIDSSLNPANPYSHMRKNSIDVQEAFSRGRRLKQQLADYSPPELKGQTKDKVAARIKELEEKISQGMPTQEEMRKNPAGMVGRHMRWEKINKKAILEWKNAKITLEADSNDPDLANVETFRPLGEMDRFRGDAQINGHMTYGGIPAHVWERIFPEGPNSALKQAQKVAEERVGVVHTAPAKVDGRKRPRTEEEKQAFRDRMALARASKGASTGDPLSPQEGESVPFEGA